MKASQEQPSLTTQYKNGQKLKKPNREMNQRYKHRKANSY